jgi:hypothetical protein
MQSVMSSVLWCFKKRRKGAWLTFPFDRSEYRRLASAAIQRLCEFNSNLAPYNLSYDLRAQRADW